MLLVLFSRMILTAVGLGMIYMTDTETAAVTPNQRRQNKF